MTASDYPIVTFALFAYNQENYVRGAIEAAFAQDYPNLEIIISDDCSTDGTWRVIQQCAASYDGPHRVVLNRNESNLGIGPHVDKVGHLAAGDLVVMGAADDISSPERVSTLFKVWNKNRRGTLAMYSDLNPIDSHGAKVDDWDDRVYIGEHTISAMARGRIRVMGASSAYTRDVFSRFGPIAPFIEYEDRILPFRALLLGGHVEFVPMPLVAYRATGGVSRGFPRNTKEYAQRVAAIEARNVREATQRLMDAMTVSATSASVKRACSRTLSVCLSTVAIAQERPILRDLRFVREACEYGMSRDLLKNYARLRASRAVDLVRAVRGACRRHLSRVRPVSRPAAN